MYKYNDQSFCLRTRHRRMYSSIAAPKAAFHFKIDWSTLNPLSLHTQPSSLSQ